MRRAVIEEMEAAGNAQQEMPDPAVIEAEAVAAVCRRLVGRRALWKGDASQLLHRLLVGVEEPYRVSDHWPQRSGQLADFLDGLAPTLKEKGVHVHCEQATRRRRDRFTVAVDGQMETAGSNGRRRRKSAQRVIHEASSGIQSQTPAISTSDLHHMLIQRVRSSSLFRLWLDLDNSAPDWEERLRAAFHGMTLDEASVMNAFAVLTAGLFHLEQDGQWSLRGPRGGMTGEAAGVLLHSCFNEFVLGVLEPLRLHAGRAWQQCIDNITPPEAQISMLLAWVKHLVASQ